MRLNYPKTPLKNVKGYLITKGDRRFRGDFVVGNLGGHLLFQADGNVVHEDVLARPIAEISRSRGTCYHSRGKTYKVLHFTLGMRTFVREIPCNKRGRERIKPTRGFPLTYPQKRLG